MEIQWPLVIFGLLAGCGGVTLAFVGLSEILNIAKKARIPAVIASLALLVVGGCASILHLAQPSNLMAAATNIFSFSGISVELITLGINFILGAVYLIMARNENAAAMKVTSIVCIPTGLLMAFVVGNGYVMEAQPYWDSITLPLGYLGGGLCLGATLFASIATVTKTPDDDIKKLVPWLLGADALQLASYIAYGVFLGFAGNAILYWGGCIAVGCVCSCVCVLLMRKQIKLVWAAFVCAFIGSACFRCIMWLMGSGFLNMFDEAAAHNILGL